MDQLIIAGRSFKSRLMVGTGKFSSNQAMVAAMQGSGSEIVTVALRRVDVDNPRDSMLEHIDPARYLLLPNTSGARDAEEAIRLARIARAAGCDPWVKLEVTPDPYYLLPDPIETLKAAEVLVKEGFIVLPYINADPVLAKHLQEAGTATVMPLGAPIGTNKGVRTRDNIAIIIEQASISVVVDAGLGARAHARRGDGQLGVDVADALARSATRPAASANTRNPVMVTLLMRTISALSSPTSSRPTTRNAGRPSEVCRMYSTGRYSPLSPWLTM